MSDEGESARVIREGVGGVGVGEGGYSLDLDEPPVQIGKTQESRISASVP